jgi:hypothetical protein
MLCDNVLRPEDAPPRSAEHVLYGGHMAHQKRTVPLAAPPPRGETPTTCPVRFGASRTVSGEIPFNEPGRFPHRRRQGDGETGRYETGRLGDWEMRDWEMRDWEIRDWEIRDWETGRRGDGEMGRMGKCRPGAPADAREVWIADLPDTAVPARPLSHSPLHRPSSRNQPHQNPVPARRRQPRESPCHRPCSGRSPPPGTVQAPMRQPRQSPCHCPGEPDGTLPGELTGRREPG